MNNPLKSYIEQRHTEQRAKIAALEIAQNILRDSGAKFGIVQQSEIEHLMASAYLAGVQQGKSATEQEVQQRIIESATKLTSATK